MTWRGTLGRHNGHHPRRLNEAALFRILAEYVDFEPRASL